MKTLTLFVIIISTVVTEQAIFGFYFWAFSG